LVQHLQDDGFREIQLNGKQLAFLFMAATVVSVVIFLCGVLVGRGVRTEPGGSAADPAALGGPPGDASVPAVGPAPAASVPVGADPTTAAPPPAVEDLSYFNRLEKPDTSPEELKAPSSQPPGAPADSVRTAEAPSAAPRTSEPASRTADAAPADPAGPQGYSLQVAALRERAEADAIANRLLSKGYAAYVLAPGDGTPPVFRVRVGTFKTRREAESVAAKLEKEEQFKPWITR
jgi:DedD protein